MKNIFLLFLPLFLSAEFAVKSYQELRNKELIKQNYEQSCGTASLATLLNMIDVQKFSELEILQMMSEKELRTDMVSFADLIAVFDKLGYEGSAYQITRQSLDKLLDIPLLVKIEDDPRFPHFVIIINSKGNFLQVFDPSFGRYLSLKRQFFSIWDKHKEGGFALIVLPKNELQKNALQIPKKQMPSSLHFEFTPFSLF
ncbi:C39 family peptidase [Campylobacter troglodytis]|uniref:C39 family peptidase n=1 Tax=Campylobacter troglodytis TaxID=654363 RepID=UPI0011581A64|nr:cysteine peptidase family C39 domain-containing protein [Campylobacter troglodytis]TQR61630.1 peptidase C39 [Campylobacter troglodytis]